MEKDSPQFSNLPFHYQQIAYMLLESASDDIGDTKEIRILLQEIADKRFNKIRSGLNNMNEQTSGFKFNNFGSTEINRIRGLITQAINHTIQTRDKIQKIEAQDKEDWKPHSKLSGTTTTHMHTHILYSSFNFFFCFIIYY